MDKEEYFEKLKKATQGEVTPAENGLPEKKHAASDDGLKNIRTFKSDIADAIKKDSLSYAKIASEEAERQQRTAGFAEPPKKARNFLTVAVSLLLLVIGIGVVFASVLIFGKHTATAVPVRAPATPEISSESESTVTVSDFDRASIISLLNNQREKNLPAGNVEVVHIASAAGTSSQMSAASLLAILGPNLEGPAARSIQDDYIFGFYGEGQKNGMFLLMHTDSYDDTYGGMLDWEKYISQDLGGLFVVQNVKISTSSVAVSIVTTTANATTTATSSNKTSSSSPILATSTTIMKVATSTVPIPLNFQFQDDVVGNKDARILQDAEGNTIFLYSFLDQQTLVFATDEQTLEEIENRIISSERIQ
jgi:hypothetical protein